MKIAIYKDRELAKLRKSWNIFLVRLSALFNQQQLLQQQQQQQQQPQQLVPFNIHNKGQNDVL